MHSHRQRAIVSHSAHCNVGQSTMTLVLVLVPVLVPANVSDGVNLQCIGLCVASGLVYDSAASIGEGEGKGIGIHTHTHASAPCGP